MTLFNMLLFLCLTTGLYLNSSFSNQKITGYNLTQPDFNFTLPPILHEISGVTIIDSVTVACIQDENGILFIYDISNNSIKREYPFLFNGDYEGIARVGKNMYVLRSDGVLFEITDYETAHFKTNSYVTGIPANNNEGLCYDAENNRLLIASKSAPGKGSEFKNQRGIYAFDITTKKLNDAAIINFDVHDIKRFAEEKQLKLPVKRKKKGRKTQTVLKFRTSEIAIHPITNKLYLLSAADHMLFIFDKKGDIEHIEQLDRDMFNKAEGITFFDDGDMLITNEGQDKKPSLLRFNYQK